MTDKITERIAELEALAREAGEGNQAVFAALADCKQALRRVVKRAAEPEGFERIEIEQDKGPHVEFTGRLLASDEFETRGQDPLRIRLEIWETEGSALIAASYAHPVDRAGFENARVTVVEPSGDDQAMRFAVMDAFSWDVRARSMAKKLGWSLRKDVE